MRKKIAQKEKRAKIEWKNALRTCSERWKTSLRCRKRKNPEKKNANVTRKPEI